jgi:hypothetical protein
MKAFMSRARGAGIVLAGLVACAIFGPARAAVIDEGTYRIYLNGRAMGSEPFFFDQFTDSVVVQSVISQIIRFPDGGEDSLKKSSFLTVDAFDLNMRFYQSVQMLRAQKFSRALVMSETTYSSYTEVDNHGSGEVMVRPPGRIYLHDPDIYVLFDVIARSLSAQAIDARPILLLVLGPRDTTLEVQAKKLPATAKKWGAKTLQSRRIELDDGVNRVVLWCDTRGRLIEMEIPASGLRVVRDPPKVKPRKTG